MRLINIVSLKYSGSLLGRLISKNIRNFLLSLNDLLLHILNYLDFAFIHKNYLEFYDLEDEPLE